MDRHKRTSARLTNVDQLLLLNRTLKWFLKHHNKLITSKKSNNYSLISYGKLVFIQADFAWSGAG